MVRSDLEPVGEREREESQAAVRLSTQIDPDTIERNTNIQFLQYTRPRVHAARSVRSRERYGVVQVTGRCVGFRLHPTVSPLRVGTQVVNIVRRYHTANTPVVDTHASSRVASISSLMVDGMREASAGILDPIEMDMSN